MIVDDNKFIRESLPVLVKNILKSYNKINEYEVIEGSDGVDILSVLIDDQKNNNLVKCIITDENTEYINGSDAVTIIRKLEKENKLKQVFIVSISAFEDEYYKNKIIDSGVDCIMSKPCSRMIMQKFFNEFKILGQKYISVIK